MTISPPSPGSTARVSTRRAVLAATAAALLLSGAAARADVEPLAIDLRWDLPITAGAALGTLVLSAPFAEPGGCRWCATNRFDRAASDALRWSNTSRAGTASDALVVLIPAAAAANSFFSARQGGSPAGLWGAPTAFWEDSLVIAEAASIAGLLNGIAKTSAARSRPGAGPGATGASNKSFYSGHTTLAFSVAAAAGTVSTMRGYPSAPWVWAGGMTLAGTVGYLRIAANEHWATDVIAGAAVSGLVGWAVPWFFHRANPEGSRVSVVPSPGGFALVF